MKDERGIKEVRLCLVTLIYTVGVCIIRRDIMVTIVLTSNFSIFQFTYFIPPIFYILFT